MWQPQTWLIRWRLKIRNEKSPIQCVDLISIGKSACPLEHIPFKIQILLPNQILNMINTVAGRIQSGNKSLWSLVISADKKAAFKSMLLPLILISDYEQWFSFQREKCFNTTDCPTARGSGKAGYDSSWSTPMHAGFLCRTIWTWPDSLLTHKAKNTHMDTHAWEKALNPAHTHAQTLIELVWKSNRGPQDNIFIAIIKEKLAYGPPRANIWLWVSSIIHPLRNMWGPNFSAMKQKTVEKQ